MDKNNTGGPAFAAEITEHFYCMGEKAKQVRHPGMTLRDYFAAKALSAILSVPEDGIQAWSPTATSGSSITAAEAWAKNAYEIADAMLAERSK